MSVLLAVATVANDRGRLLYAPVAFVVALLTAAWFALRAPSARERDARRGVTAPDACDRCYRPRATCICRRPK